MAEASFDPSKRVTRCVTEHMKRFVASEQQWKCKHCHNTLDYTYQTDHVVPLSLGGTNDLTNLQALCCNCHARKGIADLHAERRAFGHCPSRARKQQPPRPATPHPREQPKTAPAPASKPKQSPYFTPGTPQFNLINLSRAFATKLSVARG